MAFVTAALVDNTVGDRLGGMSSDSTKNFPISEHVYWVYSTYIYINIHAGACTHVYMCTHAHAHTHTSLQLQPKALLGSHVQTDPQFRSLTPTHQQVSGPQPPFWKHYGLQQCVKVKAFDEQPRVIGAHKVVQEDLGWAAGGSNLERTEHLGVSPGFSASGPQRRGEGPPHTSPCLWTPLSLRHKSFFIHSAIAHLIDHSTVYIHNGQCSCCMHCLLCLVAQSSPTFCNPFSGRWL